MPRAIPILVLFLNRFWIDLCSIFRSLKLHFLLKLYWFYNIFLILSAFKIRSMFEYIFDPTWLGFWLQKSLKNPKKIWILRGIIKLIDFWTDLSSIFAPFWKPSWAHVGHLSRPKTAQEASKTPPRRSKMALKTIPRAPQDPIPPGLMGYPFFGRLGPRFWCLRASILVLPGLDFESFLI